MITNHQVRDRSGQQTLDAILSHPRLRWLGHVHHMTAERIPCQTMKWMPNGRRKRGLPRMSWLNIVEIDLSSIGSDCTTFYVRERSLVPKLSRLQVQRHGTNYRRQYVTLRQQPLLNVIWKLIYLIVPLLEFYVLYSYIFGHFIFAVSFFTTIFNRYVHCEVPLVNLYCKWSYISFIIVLLYCIVLKHSLPRIVIYWESVLLYVLHTGGTKN